ncbi:Gx transporter family protein [Eubacteriales bacterium OttesenSCG-928-M02]|nr:Gx transporter family protein [Eubacteriales bacterium OttesenSCG-928-M02]
MQSKAKNIALLAMLVAMASVVHYLEGLLPPIIPAIPGAKLGLANIFTLFALVRLGYASGFIVLIARCLVATLLGGSSTGLFYALGGGICSFFIMALLYRLGRKRLGLVGISVAGAFFHNMGQLLVAAIFMGNVYVFSYFPLLALVSIPTGMATGAATHFLTKALDRAGVHPNG